MEKITAQLSGYRQSPRKVRLVADAIKGKKAEDALAALALLPKRAADPMRKLLASALANALHNKKITARDLTVRSVMVDKSVTLKRRRPRARGSAFPIHKHTSHIKLTLSTDADLELKNKD
ncbi:50S ribosomal protein L22 [bacterium]|nr:50S ribosomal protein L22 [bacterium]MCI0566032.1 50S ribosomal protein L22 [bacterium]MCI0680273.1 50S ribosomal protein L22 [bacterium]